MAAVLEITHDDPRCAEALVALGLESMIVVPIGARDHVVELGS